ncbi:selenocysteine-specific translation elongation factor [Spirochaetota bacterium]
MKVIGTAGHVDHGKTALIKALSGMDADRLPEEKARKMTTDLGFAYYNDTKNGIVGIVDVPGHERYIRNMVAGIWGLDLVLLIIAADDGWMPQTSLHAQIAVSMADPSILIVLNKIDLVDKEKLDKLKADVLSKAESIMAFRPELYAVSSTSGIGIPELKEGIGKLLSGRPTRKKEGSLLYVDRSFASKGLGYIVAGTLASGTLKLQNEITVYPRKEKAKIRSLESYQKDITIAEAGSRVAMGLSGLKAPLKRGDLLAESGQAIFFGNEFLIRLKNLPGLEKLFNTGNDSQKALKPGLEVELAIGSAMSLGEIWPYKNSPYARLLLEEAIACPPEALAAVLSRDGTRLLCRGSIMAFGKTGAKDRRATSVLLPKLEELFADLDAQKTKSSGGQLFSSGHHELFALYMEVAKKSWARLPASMSSSREFLAELFKKSNIFIVGEESAFAFESSKLEAIKRRLLKTASEAGGLASAVAYSVLGGDEDTARTILKMLVAEQVLVQEASFYKLKGAVAKLKPEEEALKKKLEQAGKAGLEPGKSVPQQDAKTLKSLCSAGLAVPLDGGIFLAKKTYDECVALVLKGKREGDSFSVPEAKDQTGMSRKYIIPLLNRMEDHGFVKRSGDARIVKKTISR